MITESRYFAIQELVCPHVFKKYGLRSWQFIDQKLIYVLDSVRERMGKQIFVNIYDTGLTQRGLRCFQCDLVKAKIEAGELYMSAHIFGKAADFDVEGLEAEEVRLWIAKKANLLPYPVRLESGINWCHLDVYENPTDQKVYLFHA
jgi:hypothetical protein